MKLETMNIKQFFKANYIKVTITIFIGVFLALNVCVSAPPRPWNPAETIKEKFRSEDFFVYIVKESYGILPINLNLIEGTQIKYIIDSIQDSEDAYGTKIPYASITLRRIVNEKEKILTIHPYSGVKIKNFDDVIISTQDAKIGQSYDSFLSFLEPEKGRDKLKYDTKDNKRYITGIFQVDNSVKSVKRIDRELKRTTQNLEDKLVLTVDANYFDEVKNEMYNENIKAVYDEFSGILIQYEYKLESTNSEYNSGYTVSLKERKPKNFLSFINIHWISILKKLGINPANIGLMTILYCAFLLINSILFIFIATNVYNIIRQLRRKLWNIGIILFCLLCISAIALLIWMIFHLQQMGINISILSICVIGGLIMPPLAFILLVKKLFRKSLCRFKELNILSKIKLIFSKIILSLFIIGLTIIYAKVIFTIGINFSTIVLLLNHF